MIPSLTTVHPFRFHKAPVIQKVDNAIHGINHYSLDSAIGFAMTFPLDSDYDPPDSAKAYPSFERRLPALIL